MPVLAAAVSLALATNAEADLQESPGWAVSATATAKAGYDSNLTFSQDGEGDSFGTAKGDVLVERQNSLLDTKLFAAAAETYFAADKAPSQLDASAGFSLRYPYLSNELPRFLATGDWSQNTAADPELNRRLKLEKWNGDVGGRVFTSGQFGINADFNSALYDYSSDGLGRNEASELMAGLAYDPTPLTEISANIGWGMGTASGSSTNASVRDHNEIATVQVRGQVLPKLTSTLFVGVTHITYTGGYSNSSTLPTAGGELIWSVSPGRSIRAGVGVSAGFAPDGESQRKSQASLDGRQSLSASWSVDAQLSGYRYSDRSTSFARNDNGLSAGAAVRYAPSPRFDASLSYAVLHQTSNLGGAGFNQNLFTLQLAYHI